MKKINHTEAIITKRLTLRPFKASDYKNAFQNYLTDEKTTKFMNWEPYRNLLQAFCWCLRSSHIPYHWAIVLNETNQIIGGISSRKQDVVMEKDDSVGKIVYDIGYCIGSKWWGQGVMPEAAKAVVEHMFDKVGVDIVLAMHDILNPNSGIVMRKIGMQFQENIWRPNCKDAKVLSEYCLYKIEKENK